MTYYVTSGVTSTGVSLNSDTMFVFSGGTANNTMVNSGGSMFIYSGGTATNIIWTPCIGRVVADDGADVTYASQYSGVYFGSAGQLLSHTSVLDGKTIGSSCEMIVMSGGTANNANMVMDAFDISYYENAAIMNLFSCGVANNTKVFSFCCLNVYSGGMAENTTLHCAGDMYVYSGGITNNTRVNSGGCFKVFSGGTANGVKVYSGYLKVSSGGTATDILWTPCEGTVHIEHGAVATFVSQYSGVYFGSADQLLSNASVMNGKTIGSDTELCIMSGGIANDTMVYKNGLMDVSSGGVANSAMLYEEGVINVWAGGTANYTTINSGYLYVSSFATANYTTINGGWADLEGTVNNTTVNGGGAGIESAANYTTINSGGCVYIYDGGTANSTTVNSGGSMFVFSGGTANSTTVVGALYNSGFFHVSSGGTANSTVISGGGMHISGGTANNTTVSGGNLNVYEGGTANSIIVNSNGYLCVSSGGTVNGTTVTSGGYFRIFSGGTANSTTVSGGNMYIGNFMDFGSDMYIGGGVANSVTVTSGGYLYIYEGGTATNILWTPCVGRVRVEADAHVTFVSQYSGVYFGSDDQLLSHTTVMNYQTVGRSCNMYVMSGGTANYTTVNDYGWVFIYSGGTANNTIFDSCEMHVLNGGVANNVMMRNESGADCYLDIYYGGTAKSVTVSSGAALVIHSGGTANSVTVTSGGCIYFTSGGRLTGQTIIENGAYVSAYSGAILDFDISELAPDALARVKGLSRVSGWKDIRYTLTVDGKQASGNYALAEGAAGFDRTISVLNTSGAQIGTLTVGQKVLIGNTDYTLYLFGDTLTVEVVSSVVPGQLFYPGDFAGNKKSMLALEQDRVALIYNDGAIWGGLTLDDGWSIAGVGDFNGDGADDILRVHTSGLVMGELSNGNGTFSPKVLNFKQAGWDILGTGDFNGNGMDDVLIANPTGASETVGLLGYWESGTTWTLINGYSPEWECVATGDYNGDGKCDMLWRNSFEGEGGLTYNAYCTWIVDDPVDWRMVSVANPDEWNFLCSGDFDGNKTSDIAMINKEGVVGIWGVTDGYLSSWSILSAVTSEWTLAGVADFNGDGTDDIAWSNTDTGLTGYWQIENKELASWQNIAVI